MGVVSIPSGGTSTTQVQQLARQIADIANNFTTLQAQINSAPGFFGPVNGKIAGKPAAGSMNAQALSDGSIALSMAGSNGFGTPVVLPANPSYGFYLAPQSASGAPTVTQFPASGNFGWYQNSSNAKWYFTLNSAGTMVFQSISTLSGSITTSQHGDVSGAGTTMHDFPEISGTLVSAQHGNLTGGALHAAGTSSTAGFISAAQVSLLSALNVTLTDVVSVGTPSNLVNCTALYVGGVKVLGAQVAAVIDASGTLADVVAQFNALLAHMRTALILHA